MRRTQRDVVLGVLSDGREHSTQELVDAGGGLRVPARVDELRKRGFDVRCRAQSVPGRDAIYLYRLVQSWSRTQACHESRPDQKLERVARPVDVCIGCGEVRDLVDDDYCEACAPTTTARAQEAPPNEPVPSVDTGGQLVLDDKAMRRQEAA